MYMLAVHPDDQDRLRKEVQESENKLDRPLEPRDYEKLPFLNTVIKVYFTDKFLDVRMLTRVV